MKTKTQKPIPEFTKDHKYTLIRRYSLIVATIPALVLLPTLIAMAIYATSLPSGIKNAITGPLAVIGMFSIMPGMLALAAFVILAIITAVQKPTNPAAPTPRTKLIQIITAVLAAAMPTIAFINIFQNTFNECVDNCFIFNAPAVTPTGIAYAALWILLATIWLRTKKTKTNTPN
jgi:hypothetical protein